MGVGVATPLVVGEPPHAATRGMAASRVRRIALHYTRAVRSVLAVSTLAAGACLSTPSEGAPDAATDAMIDAFDPCVDMDGDGWPVDVAGCGRYRDCNDDDGARHPGALEADDGVSDLDCNGAMLTENLSVDDLDYSGLTNGGVSVVARHLDLEFDVAASYQLSSLRTTNGVNGELLFTGPMEEKWSGTNVWQAYFSTVATGTPVMQTVGAAIFQWRVPFTSGAMIGASLYTVTIDGRVHRTDEFNVTADPTGASHSITSYIALDATKFDRRDRGDQPGRPDEHHGRRLHHVLRADREHRDLVVRTHARIRTWCGPTPAPRARPARPTAPAPASPRAPTPGARRWRCSSTGSTPSIR